jgi:hypothetical protein
LIVCADAGPGTRWIATAIEGLIKPKAWRKALAHENRGRKLLGDAAANWTKVEKMLGKR